MLYYLYWGLRLQSELSIIKKLYIETTGAGIPSSLNLVVQIIRQAEYTMEGLNKHPNSEKELDEFMENLFKPIYPDLLSTPTLPKSIKNFEPDTGIPSLRLLIEYKYVASKEQVKKVTDEISKRWEEVTDEIEREELKPRRSDVNVKLIALAWVPHWHLYYSDGIISREAIFPAHHSE